MSDSSPRPDDSTPEGTKKPSLPSGTTPSGDETPGTRKPSLPPAEKPGTKKPSLSVKKPTKPPSGGSGTKRPTLPPQARRVTGPGGDGEAMDLPVLSRKDFSSSADVRWCPGCGDYAVLAAVQRTLPELTERRENVVFISGIGCSGRFPYYMDTFGFHTIHGRAPTVATGLKSTRPELDVWVVTGDGDALSIGGNHFAHVLRRNLDCQILLFNNQIYGLTKGQYSPTSEFGKVTKSTPYGSVDHPFNPAAFALGADATFLARTLDRDPKHMQQMLREAHGHTGTGFVEIYQNCNIFNDGAFFAYTERDRKPVNALFLDDGRPMTFAEGTRGLRLDGLRFETVSLEEDAVTEEDLVTHDASDKALASLLTQQTFWDAELPRPFGVIYREDRPTYDRLLNEQVAEVTQRKGAGELQALLRGAETWTVE